MVKEWKVKLANELRELAKKHRVVGIADITGLPSNLMHKIRAKLRGKVFIKVAKKNIIRKAFEGTEFEKLIKHLEGQPALIFADYDAFEVFRDIDKLKEPAPIKAGQVAPKDIVVPAGGTGLPPGPAIGELQKAGIPAKIEKGQIAVLKDTVVAKAGEVVKPEVAAALNLLGIYPVEKGLEVIAIYQEGLVFTRDVLAVDVEKIKGMLSDAFSYAFNLAYHIDWFTKEIAELKLSDAFTKALSLALELEWEAPETLEYLISKAHAQALMLSKEVE